MNWEQFKKILDNKINLNISLKTPEQIETAVKNFTSSIQTSAWSSSSTPTQSIPHYSMQLPTFARDLISLKRRARSARQRTRLPSDKQIYNNLSNRVKKMLSELRKESLDKYTASLTVKNCSLWKATKRILRSYKTIPPLKKDNSSWAITDYDKAVLFGTHLAKVFQPHNDIPISPIFSNIDATLSTLLPMHLPPKHFSPCEVSQCNLFLHKSHLVTT